MDAAKLVITVKAGLMPGDVQEERRFSVSSSEWEQAVAADEELLATGSHLHMAHARHRYLLLAFRAAEADEYARMLRDPGRFNIVTTEWAWL
jgi:hypothetical protein